MTQVQKLTQAAGLIRQATEVYQQSLEELSRKTGKAYHLTETNMETKVEELLDFYAHTIGECVLYDL